MRKYTMAGAYTETGMKVEVEPVHRQLKSLLINLPPPRFDDALFPQTCDLSIVLFTAKLPPDSQPNN
jgi:hypothetical protein